MELVVWFIAGAMASVIGGIAGALANGWAAWILSVVVGASVVVLTGRFAAFVGVVVIAAMVGAIVASNVYGAALFSVGGVAFAMFLAVAASSIWSKLNARDASRSAQQAGRARRSASKRLSGERPLPKSRVDDLIALASTDVQAFQQVVRKLTPQQRQQIRAQFSRRSRD